MTERLTTSEQFKAPRIANAPDALQIETLDSLVGQGALIDEEYRKAHRKPDRIDVRVNRRSIVTQMLEAEGIPVGETAEEKADFEHAFTVYMIALNSSQEDWVRPDNGIRPRNATYQNVADWYKDRAPQEIVAASSAQARLAERLELPAVSEASPVIDETPYDERDLREYEAVAREATAEDLERTRKNLAETTAKRQGRLWGGKKGDNEINRAEYDQSIRTLGILTLESELASIDDPTQRNARVIEFLFDEQKKLRDLTTEKLKDSKLGRYVEWMNSGGKLNAIGKAGLIGAAAAGAGAIGMIAAPAVGVGAGIAGGFAVAANRAAKFGRAYARSDRDRGMATADEAYGENAEDLTYDSTQNESAGDHVRLIADAFDTKFEEDTKREQKKRRRAVALGAVATAVGTGVGIGIASAISHADEIKDFAADTFHSWTGGLNVDLPNTEVPTPTVETLDINVPGAEAPNNDGLSFDLDRDDDGTLNRFDTSPDDVEDPSLDRDGDGIRNWNDANPNDSTITTKLSDVSESARFIVPEEGGFQTLKELGIPEYKREEIWADAGAKFQTRGQTYLMNDGKFGWSREGRLSNDDLRVLVDAAARHGVKL